MKLLRFYETTLVERDHQFAFRYIAIPADALTSESAESFDPHDVSGSLGLEEWRSLTTSQLGQMLGAMLVEPKNADRAYHVFEGLADRGEGLSEPLSAFSNYAAYADVFAAEESPLAAKSIGTMVAKGGVTGGASLAFVAFGPTPLLFLAVPAGIVLVGAAAGVASALEQGLRTVILRRMGVDEGTPAESGASA